MRLLKKRSRFSKHSEAVAGKARSKGFFLRLLFAFLAVNITTSGVLLLTAYSFSIASLEKRTKENVKQQLERIERRFQNQYRMVMVRTLHSLINDPILDDYLLTPQEERLIDQRKLERRFLSVMRDYPQIHSIRFIDEHANVIAGIQSGKRIGKSLPLLDRQAETEEQARVLQGTKRLYRKLKETPLLLSSGNMEWFMPPRFIQATGPYVSDGKLVALAGLAKLDLDTGGFAGVVLIQQHFDDFLAEISQIKFFDENPIWLLDAQGVVLRQPEFHVEGEHPAEWFDEGYQSEAQVLDSPAGIIAYQDLAIEPGVPFLRLAINITSDVLQKDMRPAINFFSVILLVSVVLILLLSYYASHYLSLPVLALQRAEAKLANAQRIAKLGHWEWNINRGTVEWSKEAALILGMDMDTGEHNMACFIDGIHADDRAIFDDAVERVMAKNEQVSIEHRICRNAKVHHVRQEIRKEVEKPNSDVRLLGTIQDITKQKEAESQVRYLAYYDKVTGLANRSYLDEQAQRAVQRAVMSGCRVAILFLDLDHFKRVNDTEGHRVGDILLRIVADRLRASVRSQDEIYDGKVPDSSSSKGHTIARFGGDEFIVLLSELRDTVDVAQIARRILDGLSSKFVIGDKELFVSGSIGISIYPEDGRTVEELFRHADSAMYAAKARGRNRFAFYTTEIERALQQRITLETSLHHALERREFRLFYQPKIDLKTGEINAVEALLRWQHPQHGLVGPDKFIRVAEETDLITPIGQWVLEEACRHLRVWQDEGFRDLKVAVNLSPVQLRKADLRNKILGVLLKFGIDGECLELELTESVITENIESCAALLNDLKRLGASISIDDFGTGYSSLSLLKQLPVDTLKIDRSFIRDLQHHNDDALIVKTTIGLGHNLRLKVVAEGVETAEQLEFLRQNQCDEAQGFYFSRPVPAEQVSRMLLNQLVSSSSAYQGEARVSALD